MCARVMVVGRQAGMFPEGLPESDSGAEYVMAESMAEVRANLAQCDVVFQYGHPRGALSASWELAGRLRWVHVGGVGIDWALFPELMEIEQAHREKMAERLAHTLRQLGSSWSTPRLKRLALFLYEISTATWRYRSQHAGGKELLDWETAAMLATVGRCMEA